MDYLSLFFKSIFVDNMIFAYYLGMCSYLAVSQDVIGIGIGGDFYSHLYATDQLSSGDLCL